MEQNTITPALSWDWNQIPPPGFFSLTVLYRDLKHQHETDFNARDRLLSSWIISKFLSINNFPVRFNLWTLFIAFRTNFGHNFGKLSLKALYTK